MTSTRSIRRRPIAPQSAGAGPGGQELLSFAHFGEIHSPGANAAFYSAGRSTGRLRCDWLPAVQWTVPIRVAELVDPISMRSASQADRL